MKQCTFWGEIFLIEFPVFKELRKKALPVKKCYFIYIMSIFSILPCSNKWHVICYQNRYSKGLSLKIAFLNILEWFNNILLRTIMLLMSQNLHYLLNMHLDVICLLDVCRIWFGDEKSWRGFMNPISENLSQAIFLSCKLRMWERKIVYMS